MTTWDQLTQVWLRSATTNALGALLFVLLAWSVVVVKRQWLNDVQLLNAPCGNLDVVTQTFLMRREVSVVL